MTPIVPDHELLKVVARGAYGEVWLARNVVGTFRAVKVVYRASFDDARPYEREFNGLQKFEPISRGHPGLVNLLHIGRNNEAGYFYCVMEAADDLAGGENISPDRYRPRTLASEVAGRGRLPFPDCISVGIALTEALGHLHGRGLVHRDIKPSNLIYVAGVPKLADIGLVTQIGTQATFVGTEGYLAPEGPGHPAADLFALGKVLYEISMGKSQDQFPELPTRLREFPDAPGLMRLNTIILKACEAQPARRFRSAGELRTALEELRPALTVAGQEGRSGLTGLKACILAAGTEQAGLVKALAERCAGAGVSVNVEDGSGLTVERARRLEQRIRAADFVIPILTRESIRHEVIVYGLEIARQALARPGAKSRLVPVSIALNGEFPRQIAIALESATGRVAVEKPGDDTVADQVIALMRNGHA